ncbi:unnamed protein product, partial [Clonostachys rosea]
MTIYHVSASEAAEFENEYKAAVQYGTMVTFTGFNLAGGQPWIDSKLEDAGFPDAIVFWPTSRSPKLAVDFCEHEIAVNAISAFSKNNVGRWHFTPQFHQDVRIFLHQYQLFALTTLQIPPQFTQEMAKASDAFSALDSDTTHQLGQSDMANLEAQMGDLQVGAAPETQPLTRAQRQALRFGRARQTEMNPEWPKFFSRPMEAHSRLFGGIHSPYGLIKIEDGRLVPTPEQASACVSFYSPTRNADPKFLGNVEAAERKLVVTSRGFGIPYPRGPLNGVGWGEFDKFTEWQFQGRVIKGNMLDKDLVFDKGRDRPLHFAGPSGEPQGWPTVVDETLGKLDEEQPEAKTLLELLTSKEMRAENRGQIYGRGRGHDRGWGRGGGRGGRGGRAGWPGQGGWQLAGWPA